MGKGGRQRVRGHRGEGFSESGSLRSGGRHHHFQGASKGGRASRNHADSSKERSELLLGDMAA